MAAILEGNVHKLGSRVRITTELVQAANGFHLWSESFDREMSDIFAVQDEIAHAVAAALKVKLLEEKATLSSANGKTADAYNACLWGRYFLIRTDRESLEKAVGYFEQATTLNPDYASGWAGLGLARQSQTSVGYFPVEEGWRKAREAIDRALALDSKLAEAHIAMGWIKLRADRDWAGSEASFHRAIELEPGNTLAIQGAGTLALRLGRFDEAIALFRRAVEIDPLNPAAFLTLGGPYYYTGRWQEAKRAIEKALEFTPDMAGAHASLGKVYLAESRPREALADIEKEKDPVLHLCTLALVYHALGRHNESDANLAELIRRFHEIAAYQVAEVYAFRGETDQAFEWLERAYTERDPGLTGMKVDILLKGLRSDPRYEALLKRMRMPAG